MAHDDMFVVMCKILAYLYDCMKNDREPDEALLAHDGDMLRIKRGYWLQIVDLLAEGGFIRGVHVVKCDHGILRVTFEDPSVTMAGVAFMHENSTMQKAKSYLKGASDTLPPVLSSAVSALL